MLSILAIGFRTKIERSHIEIIKKNRVSKVFIIV